ncbi:MAG: ECF transporter S component [Firmicutes bacterium]|jgi:riboflavin transporter FmnP|nr:ECF transporter S component [Bacillota bacterium]
MNKVNEGSVGVTRENLVRRMVRVGFLGAVGALLMVALEIPLLPSAPYLKWDAGDVPALLGAFSMGPLAGLLIEAVKNVVWQLMGKNSTGWIGFSANYLAGASLCFTAGGVYRAWHSREGAIAGMAAGTVAMTVVMCAANYYVFFPLWGIKGQAAAKAIISAAVPFNLLKGVLTSSITFIVYKRVRRYLGRG